jgi:phosphoglycolate phosphatase-like HAD superfamily hydrolase
VIRAVVFDFDGTLVLSNAIKEDSFYAVAAVFPGGREYMQTILSATPGDRSAIWRRFASDFGIAQQAGELVDRYTAQCQTRITACPERTGASAMLQTLRARGLRLYVNSSTPTEPLLAITAARFPAATFDEVLGGHGRKLENLCCIAEGARLDPGAIVMVGDGVDDLEAAREFGCHFVGVSGGSLAAACSGSLIDDLLDLPGLLHSMKEPVHL